jgi:hypothetical protein
MIDQAEVRHLIRENKRLKAKIREQSRVFEEERAKLLAVRNALTQTLEEEQLRNHNAVEEFNSRITALEMELRRAQAEPQIPFPYASPSPTPAAPARFAELEEADRLLTQETYRILHRFHDAGDG